MSESRIAELRIQALPERLRLVRALVGSASELAGCGSDVVSRIVIAVNEACMNIIEHAYKGDPSGEIILEILNNGESLTFRITDFADPVDPDAVRPRPLEELRPGGLGTFFIDEIMDEWSIAPMSGRTGNAIELVKRIE